MLKTYKYRLYPTEVQKVLLDKHFNACRFVYNLALETKKWAYQSHGINLTVYDLQKQLTDLKKDCLWLCEVRTNPLQQSINDLGSAFSNFFKGHAGYPSFKNKRSIQSFRDPDSKYINIKNKQLSVVGFREGIKIALSRPFEGAIRSSTISKKATGKYYVSLLCETGVIIPEKKVILTETSIGIDLGLKHFLITSEGIKIDNPKHLRNSIERLKVLQRRASKKKKGSANRRKAFKKVALIHERTTNQRKDFLHKNSTRLINNHDTLCLETLRVNNMVKNHKLALSISDAGWGEFVRQLRYKAEWNGNNVLQLPTFEPSSKICSDCGWKNNDLTLSDREWTCLCGITHDRDINAAINIKNICLRNSGKGIPGESVESLAVVKTEKQKVDLQRADNHK